MPEIASAAWRGRLRLASTQDQWLAELVAMPERRVAPVSVDINRRAGSYPESAPGDPADRSSLATASILGAKLATADARLSAPSHAAVVW